MQERAAEAVGVLYPLKTRFGHDYPRGIQGLK